MATPQHLETNLGVSFRDQGLLRQALVHRSLINEQGGLPSESYERMEYLGDAVLELVISTELYRRFPNLSEGELTKTRAYLVCRESLAGVARRLELGTFLSLGKGEEATGGRDRDTNLAAVFEAVVASVYLDRDYDAARAFLLRAMSPELEHLHPEGIPPENPKSALQEHVQAMGRPLPRYHPVSSEGPDHNPVFTVEVLVGDQVVGTGKGRKKSDAERAAAVDALENMAGK